MRSIRQHFERQNERVCHTLLCVTNRMAATKNTKLGFNIEKFVSKIKSHTHDDPGHLVTEVANRCVCVCILISTCYLFVVDTKLSEPVEDVPSQRQ